MKKEESVFTLTTILIFIGIIIYLVIVVSICFNKITNLEEQIEGMPKRVCHNETVVLKYNSSSNTFSETPEKPFPLENPEFPRQICYMNYMNNNECICFVERTKEVCEIR